MLKTLSYFLAAVLLIGSAKLIQVGLFDEVAYYKSKKDSYENKADTGGKAKSPIKKADNSRDDLVAEKIETVGSNNETPGDSTRSVQSPSTNTETEPSSQSFSGDDYFQNLKNSYLNPILAELPEGRSREDVVVRYYKHNKDRDKVYVLRVLGYYLHEREAEDSKEFASNVLYYGSDVDVRDIQIVAYTLLQNGVPLKSIEPSQYDWKYHSLEIGADSLLDTNITLNLADIQSFSR